MNLIGSGTQFSVLILLLGWCPVGSLCLFGVHAGPFAWIMLFFVRRLTFLMVGQIASLLVASMLGFACHAFRGFPSIAPCLEHVCAGGGVVLQLRVLCYMPAGIMLFTLILCYLYKLWPT